VTYPSANPICRALFCFTLVIAAASATFGQMVTVPGNANIFGAGHSSPPAPGGGGTGVLPPEYDFGFTAGTSLYLTFSSITGTVIINAGSGDNVNDADGFGSASPDSSANSVDGLSGIIGPHAGFLVGVFEIDTEPLNPAPTLLNFTSLGTSFTSLAPALNQVFFIGDGLTGDGTGTTQQFQIPTGATRLFLGLADAPGYHGDPGGYDDNVGQFNASFAIVPEPSVLGLVAIGTTLAALRRIRSGR
jgi:hypothetical protein